LSLILTSLKPLDYALPQVNYVDKKQQFEIRYKSNLYLRLKIIAKVSVVKRKLQIMWKEI